MIDISYPSIKKTWVNKWMPPIKKEEPPLALAPPANNEQGSLFLETKRRDLIIKNLVKDISYVEGETVTCHNAETRKAHGDYIIVDKICDSYAKFGKKETWPTNNLPMIVTAHAVGSSTSFFCNPGFLIPLNKDGTIPEDVK